VRNRYNRL